MGRLIVLIVIVVAAVWLLKRALRAAQSRDAQQPAAPPAASEELVRCARCGVLLPRGEARMSDGVLYCSEEHARPG
jgi:uncharacterized protein